MPHNEALIVTVQIGTCSVRRVLVDQGSSAEVMYYSLFKQLKILELDFLLTDIPLVGFHGAPVWPLGQITLPVKAGSVTLSINFVIVNMPSPYNVILGRAWLHGMKAIASTYHQVV